MHVARGDSIYSNTRRGCTSSKSGQFDCLPSRGQNDVATCIRHNLLYFDCTSMLKIVVGGQANCQKAFLAIARNSEQKIAKLHMGWQDYKFKQR